MKQNRALATLLFGDLAREKRLGLAALALLFLSAGLLVLSQRPGRLPVQVPDLSGMQSPAPIGTGLPGTSPAPLTEPAPLPTPSTETKLPEIAPSTLAYPLRGESLIRQGYHSIDTAYGDLRYFDGVAWQASPGEGVRAAAAGLVRQIDQSPGEGLQVWVDHGGGLITRYGGLAVALVQKGAPVTSGQVIGEVGPPTQVRAGRGPALSFAVTLKGISVDPNVYLRK